MTPFDRRKFLVAVGSMPLAALPLAPLLGGCGASRKSVSARAEGTTVSIALSEFTAAGTGDPLPYILVRIEGMKHPICVYRNGPDEYTALSTTCTHRGCEVEPNAVYLACPCHGSEYSTTGRVLEGPAELPLKSYRTSADHGMLLIHL